MIRIAHISDIHFNKNNLIDLEEFIVSKLIDDMRKFNEKRQIDLIIISGDLLDKGEESYENDIELGFLMFEEKVIKPFTDKLGLKNEQIFFTPGNHDIYRKADSSIAEKGLADELSSIEAVNNYIDSGSDEGSKRISQFKKFEQYFYNSAPISKEITNYQSSYIIKLDGKNIGITCFNSAWRCYGNNDKGKLLLGERQITNSLKFIKNCDLKIGIIHHPIDWLSNFEIKTIEAFIKKDYNILFCGHIHEGTAWTKTDMYGNLIVSVAPANWAYNIRSFERLHANGYSIIDIDMIKNKMDFHHRRYAYLKQKYDPNLDLGDDSGKVTLPLLNDEQIARIIIEKDIVSKIKNMHFDVINENLISSYSDTEAPNNLPDIFVMPRIIDKIDFSMEEKDKPKVYELDDICSIEDNLLITGTKESGKTILLDRIWLEFINSFDKYEKIPIIIDMEKFTHMRLETEISLFVGIEITKVVDFIKNHKIVLIIDNLCFSSSNSRKLKRLEKFLKENPNIRIITSCTVNLEGEYPIEILNHDYFSSLFKALHVTEFKVKEIKMLMQKWFSTSKKPHTSPKLNKLLNVFMTLNIPRTPLAVSMFLWIIEQQENYKPINNATMLENFVEKLFKKQSKKEIYSETFDYRNKERMLTQIARKMYEIGNDNYHMDYNDLRNFIDQVIKAKKFQSIIRDDEVLQHFIDKGLLVNENNMVRFRFSCFFKYFLMKNFDIDSKFKDYVLEKENYLNFVDELDYYTGIKRDQSQLLAIFVERMNHEFKEIIKILKNTDYGLDTVFETKKSIAGTLDKNDFLRQLTEKGKPTEDQLDQISDQMLDEVKHEEGIEKKDIKISTIDKFGRIWTLCAKVLKNTEETEDGDLKSVSYDSLLVCSIAFASVYKLMLNDYLSKNKGAALKDLYLLEKFLPLVHQAALHHLMGTAKLIDVIREKIEKDALDNSISEIERYMSVFIYADLKGKDYLKYIADFIKKGKRSYTMDMILFKVITYYFLRSKGKKSDTMHENILANVIINAKGLNSQAKSGIILEYRKRRDKVVIDDENTYLLPG